MGGGGQVKESWGLDQGGSCESWTEQAEVTVIRERTPLYGALVLCQVDVGACFLSYPCEIRRPQCILQIMGILRPSLSQAPGTSFE